MTAMIARLIGEDPGPYEKEAELILSAINRELWIEEKGWWAEFVDNMGHGMRHENAALWSIYHAIDSDVHDPFKAYQATRYVDTGLPHIPVVANGYGETSNYMVATTNWQPYQWSINNVAFAETSHTALAYWQAGRYDEAFRIFKGTVLDAMYFGSGPGNITQVSYYDAARGELYRDFADPVAMGTRALVQGMFGIIPDMMNGRLVIRPGFPAEWDFAEIETLNMAYSFRREGNTDRYTVTPALLNKVDHLTMELIAPTDKVGSVTVNGKPATYEVVADAVRFPRIRIDAGAADNYDITVVWEGSVISSDAVETVIANGNNLKIDIPCASGEIYDPQGVLTNAKLKNGALTGTVSGHTGHRTVFVNMAAGDLNYWTPVDIEIVRPVEIVSDPDSDRLEFTLVNNTGTKLSGSLLLNSRDTGRKVDIEAGGKVGFTFSSPDATLGTNRIQIKSGRNIYSFEATNWNIANPSGAAYRTVDMSEQFNDKGNEIFQYGKYVSPRYEYTTLQVPTQGMGQWCHPMDLTEPDDSGLRAAAARNNDIFTMPQGVPFSTPGDRNADNILFTTLWDNYPTKATIPLDGRASKAYLLVAASTYHMQVHILNGQVRVGYKDGSEDVLDLVLPDNLIPLNQDIFIDGWAFDSPQPRPWRVRLKTGQVSRNHAADLGKIISNDPIWIDGGMATMLDLPLDPAKELESLSLETIANEVVIGLMGVTLMD